jgi:hypothetical protein
MGATQQYVAVLAQVQFVCFSFHAVGARCPIMDALVPPYADSIPSPMFDTNSPRTLHMVPHAGKVFIDRTAAGFVVTHMDTLRRQAIPAIFIEPFLTFGDGGFGCIVDEGSDNSVLLEDFLTRILYRTDMGELWVMEPAMTGQTSQWSLTQRLREFISSPVTIKLGPNYAGMQCYKMALPRGSCFLAWSTFDFYKQLNLVCYKKQPSKWAYEMMPSWVAVLARLELTGHAIKSYTHLTAADCMLHTECVLPTPAMTTIGTLVLFAKWACATPRHGGLRDVAARALADRFFRALVCGSHVDPFDVTVELDKDWSYMWPRPQPVVAGSMVFRVTCDGSLDVSSWRDEAATGIEVGNEPQNLKVAWFSMFGHLVDSCGIIKLADWLLDKKVVAAVDFERAWLQLVVRLAHRLEVVIVKSSEHGAADWPVKVTTHDDAFSWHPREVDKECMMHREACRKATVRIQNVGIACDKVGGCRGLELQNAFMTLPSNVAFELIPQVPELRRQIQGRIGFFVSLTPAPKF